MEEATPRFENCVAMVTKPINYIRSEVRLLVRELGLHFTASLSLLKKVRDLLVEVASQVHFCMKFFSLFIVLRFCIWSCWHLFYYRKRVKLT